MAHSSYPSPEHWRSIQGGEPLLIGNEPATMFEVVHVFDNEQGSVVPTYTAELAEKYAHYGCIIDTPAIQMNASVKTPTGLLIGSSLDSLVLPATMLIDKHGKPCADRSGPGREAGYRKLRNKKDWQTYLYNRAAEEWDIWTVEQQPTGLLKLCLKAQLAKHV